MKTYQPTSLKQKLVLAAVTILIGMGVLEFVAVAMKYPDPETMAVRAQVLAAQSERAYQLRTLQNGELRLATGATSSGAGGNGANGLLVVIEYIWQ